MLVLDAALDVSQARADAVLVTFQRGEVDGIGEVGGEELVRLILQAAAVGGEFCEFFGSGCEAFVECFLDLLGEADVLGLVDRDAGVAVGDELFSDRNGYCAAGALGLAGASSAAGVVGVLDALLVCGEVELQP